MPRLAPRPCNIPGCSGMAEQEGYCDTHASHRRSSKKKEYDKTRPSSSKRGYNRSHYRLRRMIMAEQPICDTEGCNKLGVELDHRDGDPWNRARENIHMMCKIHHSQKTAREQGGGWKGGDRI